MYLLIEHLLVFVGVVGIVKVCRTLSFKQGHDLRRTPIYYVPFNHHILCQCITALFKITSQILYFRYLCKEKRKVLYIGI